MVISIDDIRSEDDPYQIFCDSIKNKETFRKYKTHLYKFLKTIGNPIYSEYLGDFPPNEKIETLSKFFVSLSEKLPKVAHNVVTAYLKEIRKQMEAEKKSPNTFPTYVKPIRKLLDANAIPFHWKSLQRLYPREAITQDRGYSREELQDMIDVAIDLIDKVIITLGSSTGFRKESWDYFRWKDIRFFGNDENPKGGAILVYSGDPESYWTHFTPEAAKYLLQYRELWKSQVGSYPQPDDPLLKITKSDYVKRLNSFGVKKRVERLAKKIGMRTQLEEGKRRYHVPLLHGFRKYTNTMMRRAKVDYLDKEDILGHSVGLEKHYERYTEEDFERFSEYQKAIPFLTISDTERVRFENQKLLEEKSSYQITSERLDYAVNKIEQLEAELARRESVEKKSKLK